MLAPPLAPALITKKQAANTTYSLTQVVNILTLADQLMSPATCRLFKDGYDGGDAVEFFKLNILPKIDSILSPEQLKDMSEGIFAKHPVKYKPENMHHVWAQLIKSSIKDCFLLGFDMTSTACWQLFTLELQKLHQSYFPILSELAKEGPKKFRYAKLSNIDVHKIFLNFMALLQWSGNIKAVTILHQFFYIAKKVSKEPASTMTALELGTYIGPCLVIALRRNYLVPPEEKYNLESEESFFFARMTGLMIEHPIFDELYVHSDYTKYLHSQERVLQLRDELMAKLRPTLWPVDMLKLERADPLDNSVAGVAKMSLDESIEKKKNEEAKEKSNKKEKKALAEKLNKEMKDKDKKEKKDKKDPTKEASTPQPDQNDMMNELKAVLATKEKKVTIAESPLVLPAPIAPAFAKARLSNGSLTPRKFTESNKDTIYQIKPD